MPVTRIAIAVLILATFTACSKRETTAEKAAVEGILLVGNGDEPSTIDPHLATSLSEAHVLFALFEGLISPDPNDPNAWVPGTALAFSRSGLRYQFTLRSQAQWSDSSPVTAKDFALSARRALSSQLGAAYPEMFFDIANAEAYHRGELESFDQVGIRAISEDILEIELKAPSPNFLNKLKHFAWLPVPTASILKQGDLADRSIDWTEHDSIVSNGPYRLASWQPNSVLEVESNPHYWDTENVQLKKIRFFPYEDAQVEHRAFLSGQLHVTDKIPGDQLGNPAQSSIQRSDPFLATSYLIFNTKSDKLRDPRLREALSLALNKHSLTSNINRSGKAATSFTPPQLGDYPSPRLPDYNPTQARERFETLFPQSSPQPALEFIVSNDPASRAVAEAIQAMWQKTLGIEVTLLNMEAKSLFSSLNSRDFEISYLSWSGDYEDPVTFLDIWKSGNSKNRASWSNPHYDSLLEDAARESDADKRMEFLVEAEAILLKELPIIPIIWKSKNYNISPLVENWRPSVLDTRSYKAISLSLPTE